MLKLLSFATLLLFSIAINAQKNVSFLINLVQTNNHFDFEDLTGEVYPLAPRVNFVTSEQVGLSIRSENIQHTIFEFLISGAKGSTNHTNGVFNMEDINFKSYVQNKLDVHLRLEIGKMFVHSSLPKFTFGFSGSLDPRYTRRSYIPNQNNIHGIQVNTLGLALNLNPQIEVNINDKLIVTMKMPLELLNYVNLDGNYNDPNKNAENQVIASEIVDLFLFKPTYSFGVGYYLVHQSR